MPTAKKEQTVGELAEKFSNATITIVTSTRGLTVSNLQTVRSKMREQNIEYTVAKNTLSSIALTQAGVANTLNPEEIFAGPTTLAFSYEDEVTPAKLLKNFAKDFELLEIKGAIYNGTYLTANQVTELADMPSKEQLLGKFVGMLQSPLYGLLNVAQGKQRELLYALKAIADNKAA